MRFSAYTPLTLLFFTSAVSALIIPSDADSTTKLADGDMHKISGVGTPPKAPQLPRSPAPPAPSYPKLIRPTYKTSEKAKALISIAIKQTNDWLLLKPNQKQREMQEHRIMAIIDAWKIPDGIIVSTMIYLKRLYASPKPDNARVVPDGGMRTVMGALILSYKMHNDAVPTDQQWGSVARFTPTQITKFQVQLMELMEYNLHISAAEFDAEAKALGVIRAEPLPESTKNKNNMVTAAKKVKPSKWKFWQSPQ
jgi:hypothetical protein